MRNILISVNKNGRIECEGEQLGFSGEHNAVTVTATFSKDAELFISADYFRFITDGHYSDELHLEDGDLHFTVPQECMQPPEVNCQIVGYTIDGEEPTIIVKTEVFKFKVERSEVFCQKMNSEPDVFERAMEKCRASAETAVQSAESASSSAERASQSDRACTEFVETAEQCAESARNSAMSAEKSAQALSKALCDVNNVANALKGSKTGSVVAMKDVSPIEHDVKVKISGVDGTESTVKTATMQEKGAEILLDAPASSVRAVTEGGAYCVGAVIPLLDGDDLAGLNDFGNLAVSPVRSYGEVGGVADVTYSINGNILSWVGTVSAPEDFSDVFEPLEISGQYTLSSSGQRMIGFCQAYGLEEDNPLYKTPEADTLDMQITVFENETKVGIKVYGKNFFETSSFELTGKTTAKILYQGHLFGAISISWEQNFLASSTSQNGFISVKNITTDTTKWLVANAQGQGYYAIRTVDLGEGEYEIKLVNGAKFTGEITNMQLEFGNTATEYEPYKGLLATYVAAPDGAVEGVKSIYPSMTFIPDAEGVTVEVEYNRDINKAFAELQTALISMGGNV